MPTASQHAASTRPNETATVGGSLRRPMAHSSYHRLVVVSTILLVDCSHSTPPPPPEAHVSVVTIQAQAVPIVTELPGRVNAYRTADVRPQVNGIILRRLFIEGSDSRAIAMALAE